MTEKKKQTSESKNVFSEIGDSMGKFATSTVETIKNTIDKALESRNTVLTIRVNDDANDKMNMLVATGIFKSRSEAAAFLIEEGIKFQDALFGRIAEKLKKINEIREELHNIVSEELGDKVPNQDEEDVKEAEEV